MSLPRPPRQWVSEKWKLPFFLCVCLFITFFKLGLIPRFQVIFPEINGPSHCFRSRPQKLVTTSFALWICQVCNDLKKLVATFFQFVPTIVEWRPNVLCCDRFLLFLVVDVVTTISCRDLTVLPFAKIYVATSISCRGTITVASYVDLCCDHIFLAP